MKLFYFRSTKSGVIKYAIAAVNGNEAKQLITDRLAEVGIHDPEWPNKVTTHSANVGEVVFVTPSISPESANELTPAPAVEEKGGVTTKSAKEKAG